MGFALSFLRCGDEASLVSTALKGGVVREYDAADAAVSLEFDSWAPDCSLAQSLFAVADRDLYGREDDADWIPGILGILVDGARQPVAVSEVDGGDGSVRASGGEDLAISHQPSAISRQPTGKGARSRTSRSTKSNVNELRSGSD